MARRPVPETPGPGQESVWDYPRPPRVEPSSESLEVWLGGVRIAATTRSLRVLETSHPPAYYLPADDFEPGALRSTEGSSWCEFKGQATYFDGYGGGLGRHAAEGAQANHLAPSAERSRQSPPEWR